ncbi:hypothetical protein [Burkholderia sp. AU32262]|uniref:hypothetical protein n=1 Tax=Burkholderia sp. AU32262 TaxID=2879630 RepID=UPI001CF41DC3|nr:hypothetical protein [Burkholderia sp. AU32262]MCA8242555.1 hypothetical protein [Burkholderia sp. AU32262]
MVPYLHGAAIRTACLYLCSARSVSFYGIPDSLEGEQVRERRANSIAVSFGIDEVFTFARVFSMSSVEIVPGTGNPCAAFWRRACFRAVARVFPCL